MYRRTDIKILAAVFMVLLAVVIISQLTGTRKSGRTFRSQLVSVEAGDVTTIEVFPKAAEGERIVLTLEDSIWMAESKGNKYLADPSLANSMIGELNALKPDRVAASGKDRWKQYQVTDSLATRVRLLKGNNLLEEMYIGKFTYSQDGRMATYLRLAGDNRVYGVDGMIGMTFNRNLNAFRNRKVIQSSSSDWAKLTFTYSADSSFVLQKVNDKWMDGSEPADSASVARYFAEIASLTESSFYDGVPSGNPTHRLLIEGNNQMQPVQVSGYQSAELKTIIESSQNRGNYFDNSELVKKVFAGKQSFLK
jgi:hypothetical protein